jgi:3-methyladenine DNA glycosylase AlkD
MTPAEMHTAIRAELIANSEPWKLPVMQRFFKDPIDAYCTYTLHVRNLAKQHGAEFALWPDKDRTALTRALWASGKYEEGSVAILLYARMRRKCTHREWKLFEKWLKKNIQNWAHCDTLCAEVLGPMLIVRPEWIVDMNEWAAAGEKYQRRAALVAPLKGLRKGLFRQEAEALKARLTGDPAEIVRKGIIWLRRELAR